MTRIAHVSTTFNPGPGVMANIMALALDQQRQNWQVEFVTGRHASPELIRKQQKQGFPVHQIASLRKYIHPVDELRALGELVRLFRKKDFDVVHTHLAKAGILGRLAARLAGTKNIIHTVYGASFAPTLPLPRYLAFWGLEKLAGNFTDQFIFVSNAIRDAYVRAGVCPLQKAGVIYYGRDLSPFMAAGSISKEERQARRRAAGFDSQTILMGSVQRLVPWKGHDYALEVLHQLKKEYPNLKLIIVGAAKLPSEQGHKEKLVAKAKALGIEEDVIFTGWQDDLAFYYSIFDIYIMTSMPFEGLSGSSLEAYASGLPLVGFNCCGMSEIMGDNGRLVPTKDVAGLVAALKREIHRLPETRRRRGEDLTALRKLQERHTFARMVAETGKLYTDLLGKQQRSPQGKED